MNTAFQPGQSPAGDVQGAEGTFPLRDGSTSFAQREFFEKVIQNAGFVHIDSTRVPAGAKQFIRPGTQPVTMVLIDAINLGQPGNLGNNSLLFTDERSLTLGIFVACPHPATLTRALVEAAGAPDGKDAAARVQHLLRAFSHEGAVSIFEHELVHLNELLCGMPWSRIIFEKQIQESESKYEKVPMSKVMQDLRINQPIDDLTYQAAVILSELRAWTKSEAIFPDQAKVAKQSCADIAKAIESGVNHDVYRALGSWYQCCPDHYNLGGQDVVIYATRMVLDYPQLWDKS